MNGRTAKVIRKYALLSEDISTRDVKRAWYSLTARQRRKVRSHMRSETRASTPPVVNDELKGKKRIRRVSHGKV